MRYIFTQLTIFLVLVSSELYAQESTETNISQDSISISQNDSRYIYLIGTSFISGYMIPHAKEVVNVRGLNPRGYELDLYWHLDYDDVWNDCQCYPRVGAFFAYYDFDQEEILGHGFSAGLNFTYFFGLPDDFNFHLKGKGGLSYLTNPFDKDAELRNWSYSTHFNYILSVGGGITYKPLERIELQLDGSMNHQSNAALLEPNGGVNYWALALSANYFLDKPDFYIRDIYDPYLTAEKKKRWDVSFSWGISSMPYPMPGQVPMYGITILRSIQTWRVAALTFAAELERNGRAVEIARREYPDQAINPYRGSLLLGVEFLMGKTILSAQLGGYVYRSFAEKDDIYQRWGVMYNIIDNIYIGSTFKSYRNSADHLSLRFTYSFR